MNYNPTAALDASQITDTRDMPALHAHYIDAPHLILTPLDMHPLLTMMTATIAAIFIMTISLTIYLLSD